MSNILNAAFSQGYVSTGDEAKSAYDLEPGELTRMLGAYYRKNDSSQAHAMPGRALFGSAGSTAVKGIAICQFDSGTDKLLASVGTSILAATPGSSGTFASLITGLDSSATRFTACHQDDRWYLGNGFDANQTLMPDGTTRSMSMAAPQLAPTLTTTTVANTTARPTVSTGTMTQAANSYDTSADSFGNLALHGTHGTVTTVTQIWSGWAANATSTKKISVVWDVSISTPCTVVFEFSVDGGVTYADLLRQFYHGPVSPGTRKTAEISITQNNNLVYVRGRLVQSVTNFNSGSIGDLKVYDVNIQYGSDANVSTTLDGVKYAFTEVYAPDDLESELSGFSDPLTLSSKNQVVVTRPAATNSHATHWRVYRVGDGVDAIKDNFGRVSDLIEISSSTWADNFNTPITEQATPIISLVQVGDTSYYRDSPAPSFINMVSWKGSVCGISRDHPRAWFYSEGGRPESFPEIYQVVAFSLEEHDALVGQMPVGDTMVLLCQGAALAVDDTPRATDGVFNAATARPIKGHPGCVGEYAYTTFSVAGEPRGAWVSPFGVYVTNGVVCACISTDLAWEREVNPSYLSNAVLRWDAKNLILWFQFDSDGDGLNDREMPFHMAQAHSKGESRPKLGQPTPKATSCMASALIGTTHYRFSGHPSNGSVYLEEVGREDAATGENVAMSLRTGKISRQKTDLGIQKGTLIHGDFGTGEQATVTTTTYRDTSGSTSSRTNDVSISGHRGSTFFIGRAGEAVDFQVDYDGDGTGGILGIQAEIDGQGRSGSANRWVSASATP